MKYAHYITFLTTKRYHQKAIESEFSTLEYNDFKNIAEEF